MQPIRTYDLAAIARGSNDVLSREEAAELQAQCIDCGRWISQDQDHCSCGSLVSWKSSSAFKQKYLVLGPEMPTMLREFLQMANTRQFRNGQEYHRARAILLQLSADLSRQIMRDVKLSLRGHDHFSSRAFVKYALNALEQRAPESASSLLDGDEVYRG